MDAARQLKKIPDVWVFVHFFGQAARDRVRQGEVLGVNPQVIDPAMVGGSLVIDIDENEQQVIARDSGYI